MKAIIKSAATIIALLASINLSAQESLWNQAELQSPIVNEDNTVSFQIFEIGRASCRERV